jgi:putative ABC transport system permease protein
MLSDLRYAFRQLAKSPGFTIVAVLTLALGIGANTALFSLINGVLLKPLPYPHADRIVQVWEPADQGKWNVVAPGVFLDWKKQSGTFEYLAAFMEGDFILTGTGEPEQVHGVRMSANGLNILAVVPPIGRGFALDEDRPGKERVVILTDGLWRRRFSADPKIVGHTVRLNDENYTVVGVLSPRALPWNGPEFIIPYVFTPEETKNYGGHYLKVFGRVKPDMGLEQASAELTAISKRSSETNPEPWKLWTVKIVSLQDELSGRIKQPLLVLLSATGVVLLIACANVANLLLAKASGRQQEIALRVALGATRGRIVRQLLTESVLLSVLGAAAGGVLAFWGVDILAHAASSRLSQVMEVGIDFRVLACALTAAVITGVGFGTIPALCVSRPDLQQSLKQGGRNSLGGENSTRSVLIISEIALALMLLVGAGLLLRSFFRLSNVSPGFDASNVLTLEVTLPEVKYPDARRAAFFEQIVERIAVLPGVETAGIAGSLPIVGSTTGTGFTINGRADAPPGGHHVVIDFCTPDYFRAMGIPLLRGRFFSRKDSATRTRVVLINEALAHKHFANEDPVGQHLHAGDEDWEIVGVVGDVRQRGLNQLPGPVFYRPPEFSPGKSGTLVVRTKVPPLTLAKSVREAILEIDPQQPAANVRAMKEIVTGSLAGSRFIFNMLGLFAATALALAAIGLYGVIAYSVTQRTREIGIRLALGGSRQAVVGLVLRQGIKLASIGVILGIAGALGVTRLLGNLLYETNPMDPGTFGGVVLVLLMAAMLASWLPARRAANVDPMVALRSD